MKNFYSLLTALSCILHVSASVPVLSPAPSAKDVNVDTRLTIRFDSDVTVGNKGKIRIIDADTDICVDSLDLSIPAGPTERTRLPKPLYALRPYVYDQPRQTNRTVKPGTPSGSAAPTTDEYQLNIIGGFTDGFHFYPVITDGKTAEIYPHNNMLDYGHTYYVTVEPDVFSTAKGRFKGVSKKDGWRFSVRASAPAAENRRLVVAADGTGDFNTLQGAMDHIPDFNEDHWTVFIKNGDYEELVYFRNKRNVTIEGESRDGVYVHYANNEVFNPHPDDVTTNEWLGTFPSRRAAFMMDNCSGMILRNFTVATTLVGQAEGLLIMGDRNQVLDVTIKGSGDALQVNGSTYFENCLIEGHGDTVLGRGPSFFKNCTLKSQNAFVWIRNTASTHGNVFVGCTFIGVGDRAVLARTNPQYPHTEMVLIDCKLDNVPAEGWSGIDKGNCDYVRYWEYGSTNLDGSSVDFSKRAYGSQRLDPVIDRAVIEAYRNPAFVLGWKP